MSTIRAGPTSTAYIYLTLPRAFTHFHNAWRAVTISGVTLKILCIATGTRCAHGCRFLRGKKRGGRLPRVRAIESVLFLERETRRRAHNVARRAAIYRPKHRREVLCSDSHTLHDARTHAHASQTRLGLHCTVLVNT